MPAGHVNGVELYWEQRGTGPRLLFCNGSGTTLQAVRPLLDLVAARFDLLAWDYRGLGRSVPLRGPYTMADLAADAVGLLQIAGWDERWFEAHPADRALAKGLTAAGHDQQDPAATAAHKAQLEARAGHDVWNRLGAISCPALVGYGNYDQIAPVQNSTAIASRLRGAKLRGYEGGHLFLVQDPAALPEFQAFLQAPPG